MIGKSVQRLVSLRTCTRQERRLIALLRTLSRYKLNDPSVLRELSQLDLDRDAGYVFSRLLAEIESLENSFQLLAPPAGFVSNHELNLLTALRRAALSPSAQGEPLPKLDFATPAPLRELLASAGQHIRHAGIVLPYRPLLSDAIDVHQLATKEPDRTQTGGSLRPALVSSTTLIAPNLRRVTMTGTALREIAPQSPAQWIKVFAELPSARPPGDADPGSVYSGRIYTVRKFDQRTCTVTIDIVLHESGSVSRRLDTARPGDLFYVTETRGGFISVPDDCQELVLGGDETAMPAIASILESLPTHVSTRIFIEVDRGNTTAHEPLEVSSPIDRVYHHPTGQTMQGALAGVLAAWSSHHPSAYVWAAGEAGEMREVRRALLAGPRIDARRLHTTGYWKRGEAGHCDVKAWLPD